MADDDDHGQLYAEFDGPDLDPQRLTRAAAALTARHPQLRVGETAGDPSIPVDDLREHPDTDAERELTAIREAGTAAGLGPSPLRLGLTRLPGGRARLHVHLDLHDADLPSLGILMADLASAYTGAVTAELNVTVEQYRRAVPPPDEATMARDRAWWRERLPGLAPAPGLPTLPRWEQTDPRRITRRSRRLGAAVRDGVYRAAHQHGVSVPAVAASVLTSSLAAWSSRSPMLLALVIFDRRPVHAQVGWLVGDFSSVLPVQVDPGAAVTAVDCARAVTAAVGEAAAHAGHPGRAVLDELAAHREKAAPVAFTGLLGAGDFFTPAVTATFGEPVWLTTRMPGVDLDAQVIEVGGELLVNWSVREDVFRPGAMDAMFAHYVDELLRLADTAADVDPWTVAAGSVVPEGQFSIRAALNAATSVPSGKRLHDGLFRAAQVQPNAIAVIAATGQISYLGLARRASAVASALTRRGVGRGDVVAVTGDGIDYIAALLGTLAAGAAFLPVTDPADLPVQPALVLSAAAEPVTGALSVADAVAEGHRAEPVDGDPGDRAAILFTAGSHRAVELTHDALMNTVEFAARHFGLSPADRVLAVSPSATAWTILDVFATLATGGTVVVVDEARRRDPAAWARLVAAYGVTVLNAAPGAVRQLVEAGAGRLGSLRVVVTGSDPIHVDLATAVRREAPQARFIGLGGSTETALAACFCEPAIIPSYWTGLPYGRPLPNTACRVVTADGADCPDWVVGELLISGRGLAQGYSGDPELTALRFTDDDGRRWFRTGDRARYWPNGTLEVVGRAGNEAVIGDRRVNLDEVTTAVHRIRGVAGAVVLALPGDDGGVLAALVQVDDPEMTEQRLARAMSGLLPAHQVPTVIRLTGRLPYTAEGRVDRVAAAGVLVGETIDLPAESDAVESGGDGGDAVPSADGGDAAPSADGDPTG